MNKELISKSCKRLTATFAAALLLVGAGNVTADVFANAADTKADENEVHATGCIPDSEEVIEEHLASDEQVYDLDYINVADETTHDLLVNICKAAAISSLPSSVDLTTEFPIPGSQGSQGSCTAWAVGYALKSHQEYKEHGWAFTNKTEYSPAYIYNQINGGSDKGSVISTALDLVVKKGVCSLYNMKYNQNDYTTKPNESQKDVASNFKGLKSNPWNTIKGIDEIKARLNAGDGVVISVGVYKDFDDISSSNPVFDTYDKSAISYSDWIEKDINYRNTHDYYRGNHAICLIGYDDSKQAFKFINSWGVAWGINGYGYVSYDLFDDYNHSSNTGYIIEDTSHSDSSRFFTSAPSTGYLKAKSAVRAYKSADYYVSGTHTDNYAVTLNKGDVIKVAKFVKSANGLQPYFVTDDGLYVNAQKSLWEETDEASATNEVFINGDKNNSVSSINHSETSSITFTPNSNEKYNNHNSLKIDYTVNHSDSYGGYAGGKISADSNASTNGATGIGFWYKTPANLLGNIAICIQGSVEKKIVEIPTTKGEWKYYSNSYKFNGSNISDIEIYINGCENDCVTTVDSGSIYLAEISLLKGSSKYAFKAIANEGGTVSGDENSTYRVNTELSVTAKADDGYLFTGWSKTRGGTIISTDATYTFKITEDTTLYANFTKKVKYTISAVKTEGCFSVRLSSYGPSTADFTSSEFEEGQNVSFSAVAESGYDFVGWWTNSSFSGDPVSTDVVYNFNVTSSLTLYPKFKRNNDTVYTVTVVKGAGCSNVVMFNSQSNGNAFTSSKFKAGDSMTFIASALSGYTFVGWWTNSSFSGDPISTSNVYNHKVTGDITLYPKFVSSNPSKLTFTVTASEGGTVSGDENSTYRVNTELSVTAKADDGYLFTGWSKTRGGTIISTDATYTFKITEDTTLYANFTKKVKYTISAVKTEGCFSVRLSSYGPSTADFTSSEFEEGQNVSFNAVAESGYDFVGWWTNSSFSGDPVSTDVVYNFNVTSSLTLYPKFKRNNDTVYTVTVVKGAGCSNVVMFNSQSNGNAFTSSKFKAGDSMTFIASALSGYTFVGWWTNSSFSGDPISTSNVYNHKVTGDITLYPKFVSSNPSKLTFTVTASEGGYVEGGSKGLYNKDESIYVTAHANDGYKFKGWSKTKDSEIISTYVVYNFAITENTTLYAHFEKIPEYTITIADTTGLGKVEMNGNTGNKQSFRQDETVDVVVYPADGYTYHGLWQNPHGTGVPVTTDSHYTIHVSGDVTLYPSISGPVYDPSVFIKGVSNNVSDWTNANSGSSLNITPSSPDYLRNNGSVLKVEYTINTNDQYGGYAGRSISLESTFDKNYSNYDGIGFWYLTPSGFNGQIALCLQSNSAGLDDLVQLSATNGEWKYYFYETSKTNIDDMTLYINGSKNGYTTTASNGVASGTFYISDMKLANK